MTFNPKSFQSIVAEMAAKVSAETPINDYTPGSVILTLLEAAAQEDFQQYIQMIEVVRNYNLDTTEGEDLDKRAFEFGLTRLTAKPHSGFVTVHYSRFNKIFTKLYAGLPGPTAGSTTLFVDNAGDFPSSGSVYIGRGTENSEGPISYSAAPIDNTSFWTINLDTALVNDHGTNETVILSQFGERVIQAGVEVRIPENDFTSEKLFELNQAITLLDGEDSVENVLVTALDPGGFSVPRNSIKEFVNPPFTGASVANPSPFINGRDEETDQELRDRIRETIQSLSRGTTAAIRNGILGITDTSNNSSITSANVIPPAILADGPTKVFIDNGRGLEPNLATFGLETLISQSTGGEKFFQLSEFPLAKANIVSQKVEPFDLSGGKTVILKVGTNEESFSFANTDFSSPTQATATEAAEAINNRATTFEARTITDDEGARVIITPVAPENENIKLDPASTSNTEFNFSTDGVFTLKLYKNDSLLTKDGFTASLVSEAQPFDFSGNEDVTADDVTVTPGSKVVSKSPGVQDLRDLINEGDYVRSDDEGSDSFLTKVKTVADASTLILEEPYPLGSAVSGTSKLRFWNSPQLEVAANGDINETEVISFSKTDFSTPSQALASEVLSRLRKELNLSKSELAINDTRIRFTSYLENSSASKIRILGGHGALALELSSTFGLTGSCNFQNLIKEVTGNGTSFLSELTEGQWIKATADNNSAWTKIESIKDDETLYLTEEYRGTTSSSEPALGMTFSAESVGKDKDYTLNRSNGQIELEEPLVAGESLTAGSSNTRAFADSSPQPFDFDSLGGTSNLIVRVDGGEQVTVDTGDLTPPHNTFQANSLINYPAGTFVGSHVECTSGENAEDTDTITAYNPSTGEVTLSSGFTDPIAVGDKFVLSQVLEFDHSDFTDPANVSDDELITAINSRLKGATAKKRLNGVVRVRTNNFENGSLEIFGGSANSLLNFSTDKKENQESNVAYLVSGNSDRGGFTDALGFTLSPAQNLATVFDDDPANKTFTTSMRIEGEVTGGSANSIEVSGFTSLYTEDDFFNDFWVYWKSGAANEGTLQLVTDYDAVTGTLTTQDFYPSGSASAAPASGDFVQLVPRTTENLVKLFKDLNTTTLTTAGVVEALDNTGDLLQISTKIPGTQGKVLVSGGTANSVGVSVLGPVPGAPINDVTVNSIAGLSKGMPVKVVTDVPSEDTVFISDIQGSTAPYTISLEDITGNPVNANTYTSNNNTVIQDVNGLNFDNTQVEGVDGYKFYTGLIQLAQWTIDGLDRDQSNFPGIGAAGTQFEVIPPVLVKLEVVVNVTPIDGVSLSSVSDSVSSKILEYVNSRRVGQNVILSEIVAAAQEVSGVFDVEVTNLDSNVIIADGELARLDSEDLIIG